MNRLWWWLVAAYMLLLLNFWFDVKTNDEMLGLLVDTLDIVEEILEERGYENEWIFEDYWFCVSDIDGGIRSVFLVDGDVCH